VRQILHELELLKQPNPPKKELYCQNDINSYCLLHKIFGRCIQHHRAQLKPGDIYRNEKKELHMHAWRGQVFGLYIAPPQPDFNKLCFDRSLLCAETALHGSISWPNKKMRNGCTPNELVHSFQNTQAFFQKAYHVTFEPGHLHTMGRIGAFDNSMLEWCLYNQLPRSVLKNWPAVCKTLDPHLEKDTQLNFVNLPEFLHLAKTHGVKDAVVQLANVWRSVKHWDYLQYKPSFCGECSLADLFHFCKKNDVQSWLDLRLALACQRPFARCTYHILRRCCLFLYHSLQNDHEQHITYLTAEILLSFFDSIALPIVLEYTLLEPTTTPGL
jgi:hypothetical protein